MGDSRRKNSDDADDDDGEAFMEPFYEVQTREVTLKGSSQSEERSGRKSPRRIMGNVKIARVQPGQAGSQFWAP